MPPELTPTHALPLTHTAFHRKALLLTLLTQAQAQLDTLALQADQDYDRPSGAEVLGQVMAVGLVLREMETLLRQALAGATCSS